MVQFYLSDVNHNYGDKKGQGAISYSCCQNYHNFQSLLVSG